jgi:hypothetical protein
MRTVRGFPRRGMHGLDRSRIINCGIPELLDCGDITA